MHEANDHVVLTPRQVHTLGDASNVTIICRSGAVWITLDNDMRDYVLNAGETFVTSRHDSALVYAFSSARIDFARH